MQSGQIHRKKDTTLSEEQKQPPRSLPIGEAELASEGPLYPPPVTGTCSRAEAEE